MVFFKRGVQIVAAATLLPLALAACGSGSDSEGGENEVKVAGLFALSGEFSTFDIDTMQGAQFAIDRINEEGFEVDGKTYTLDFEVTDLQSDPAVAVQSAQKAVQGFGAKIVLGSTLSALADPMVGVVRRQNDVMMLAAATLMDQYAGKGDPIFRTLTNDDQTSKQYMPVLRAEFPDVKTISTLMIDDAVGQASADVYEPQFEANGFEIVGRQMFAGDETNFGPLVQRTPKDVDAYFVGYTDGAAAGIAKAAAEAQRTTTLFSTGTTCQPGIDLAKQIDVYTCRIFTEDPFHPSSDRAQQFFDDYTAEFDTKLSQNTVQALYLHDYVYMLVEAMKVAGTVDDVDKIADALRGMSYDGVITVAFDEAGLNVTPVKVGVVRGGEVEVLPGAEG